jgi:hypothetical protein
MAHWAELDENNTVTRVLVGSNEDLDEGYQWLIDNLGGTWVKTSFNTVAGVHTLGGIPLRKNYAGIGYTYDESRDAFIPPMPLNITPDPENEGMTKEVTWVLNEDTCNWDMVE